MIRQASPVPLVTFRTPSNNPVKYPVSECQAARDQALRGMHNAGYGRGVSLSAYMAESGYPLGDP